jgi:hypothetical protein
MNIRHLVRQVGKRLVKATPVLRRHILPSSDYRLLGGIDEARAAANSSDGWFAARTVARQERAYRKLIAAIKDGEPRLDFRIAAEAVAATGLSAASRRRSLHRHRLFRCDDCPRAQTLSGDRVRGRRCDQASLPRSEF